MLIASPEDVADEVLLSQHIYKVRNSKYVFEPFNVPPRFSDSLGNGAATGATGNINLLQTPYGIYEWRVIGTQTILVPVYDRVNGFGLDFGQDLTQNDGHQLNFSPNIVTAGQSRGRHSFIIGGPPFFARLRMRCGSWNRPEFYFGFVRHQAYTSFLGNNDYAAILSPVASQLNITTRLNGGTAKVWSFVTGTVTPTVSNFELRVTRAGAVSFFLNSKRLPFDELNSILGVDPFVFDNGDIVRPVSQLIQSSIPVPLFYQEFECGYLPEKGI